MSSAAPALKAALFAACQSLFAAPILVSYGWPQSNPPELVVVGNVISEQDIATMSPQRRREELLTVEVAVCVFQGGVIDQQPVTERAYELVALLEDYLQDSGVIASLQVTLGNSVREARVIRAELTESDDPDLLATGRAATLIATVQATARV